ncbi:hypothetical protein JTB14_006567 [Gonioctena quinquepunctata]|nr:hypothetical protein JTB14_006567 [Gonioctena quinquepunctata]
MEVPKVLIEKLEGQTNWIDRKCQITIQLRAHNAWDAVIGTLETPNEPAETADEAAKVAYKNLLQSVNKIEYTAQNLIVCSLSTQVRQLINMCSSSKEMWDKLLSIFEQRTEQRQDRLFNKFFGIKEKDPLESVAKHMAKLEKFWVELQDETWKEDKVKLPESLFMNRVLNALPKEYFEFLNAWESVAKQQRTIQLLRERLCTVEMRLQEREENSDLSSKTAFVASKNFREQCLSKPSISNKNDNKKKRFSLKCYRCGLRGHLKRDCMEEAKQKSDASSTQGQELYAKKILRKFNMYDSNPVGTPIEKCQINEGFEDEEEISPNIPFRSAVGSLMYLSVATRPDITFAVHFVSQAVSKPRYHHWEIVERILKYIRGTLDYGIVYEPGECSLQAFSDSNYAGDLSTRKSTSGFICKMNQGAITWFSQKQRSVSLSTMEAEYIAGSEAAKEISWLCHLIQKVCTCKISTPVLWIDNASAVKLVHNPEFHKRSKHIDVRYHFIREKVEEGIFKVKHIAGENQIADILTKPLCRLRFEILRDLLGVFKYQSHFSSRGSVEM